MNLRIWLTSVGGDQGLERVNATITLEIPVIPLESRAGTLVTPLLDSYGHPGIAWAPG